MSENKAKQFWLSWLKVTSIVAVILGILAIAFNELSYGYNMKNFGANPNRLLMIIIGILFIGLGMYSYYIATITLAKGQRKAGYILILLLTWYLICCSASICVGSLLCFVIVTFFLIQLLAPLLFLLTSSKNIKPQ